MCTHLREFSWKCLDGSCFSDSIFGFDFRLTLLRNEYTCEIEVVHSFEVAVVSIIGNSLFGWPSPRFSEIFRQIYVEKSFLTCGHIFRKGSQHLDFFEPNLFVICQPKL